MRQRERVSTRGRLFLVCEREREREREREGERERETQREGERESTREREIERQSETQTLRDYCILRCARLESWQQRKVCAFNEPQCLNAWWERERERERERKKRIKHPFGVFLVSLHAER